MRRKRHWTICCPLRSVDQQAKSSKQQVQEFDQNELSKPFHFVVPIHPGKEATTHSEDPKAFWADVLHAVARATFRDSLGVIKEGDPTHTPIPFHHHILEEGTYRVVSRTHHLEDKALFCSARSETKSGRLVKGSKTTSYCRTTISRSSMKETS